MDRNDQQAIEGLFSKLAHVEQQAGQRDADSDRFIKERINQQPSAPYYMAQTIVVQEQALEAAQRRIEDLESQTSHSQPQRGGFFSSMFGSNTAPQRSIQPQQPQYGGAAPASPWGGQNQAQGQNNMPGQQRAGGGFLAGAAQTAMGVAGGVLLGNAIMGMMGGNEAKAAEPAAEAPAEEADQGADLGFDDTEF